MKKIGLFLVSSLLFISAPLYASGQGYSNHPMKAGKGQKQHKMAIKHVNPLPNFMQVVRKFGEQLNLNDKQQAALKKWREKNGTEVKSLVKATMAAEKKLHAAAFSHASQHDLQDLMDKVLSLRLQVAKKKIACRENMRKVLDNNQWEKLVSLYRQKIMAGK